MNLVALQAFSDNYIWMLDDGSQALVVDPGDAAPVSAALAARRLKLTQILVTHHHPDHVAGLAPLQADWPQAQTFIPGDEPIPGDGQSVADGDEFEWAGANIKVMRVPGHTRGHLAYVVSLAGQPAPWLFCGDTLFSGGCGRLFEGTPAQMADSLARLNSLPAQTQVCCAHEYTLSNLRFALAVEPGNLSLVQYLGECEERRQANRSTLPSSLETERAINPFLRLEQAEVVASAAQYSGQALNDSVAVLAALRQWKNKFR